MTKLQNFLNSPVLDVAAMRHNPKAGDMFGVEIECEGRNVNWTGENEEILKGWRPEYDGSLRDNQGPPQEWIFNGPAKYEASQKRIDDLFDYFDKRKAKIVCSNRTSIHVHFNVGDKNAYQVVNIFILFTILEDLLDRFCGEDRNGNLFCLSSRRAEDQVQWMMDACFKKRTFAVFREHFRYCSLNMASINKFGTVEFRGMRGLDNREDVQAWLKIIKELTDFACYTMQNPVDLIQDISVKTPEGFLAEVFSPDSLALLTKDLNEGEVGNSIYEGLRLVQMLCYKIGTEFDQVRLKGRDFWAAFSEDADEEPEPEIAPEQLVGDPLMEFVRFPPENNPMRRLEGLANPARRIINEEPEF